MHAGVYASSVAVDGTHATVGANVRSGRCALRTRSPVGSHVHSASAETFVPSAMDDADKQVKVTTHPSDLGLSATSPTDVDAARRVRESKLLLALLTLGPDAA